MYIQRSHIWVSEQHPSAWVLISSPEFSYTKENGKEKKASTSMSWFQLG